MKFNLLLLTVWFKLLFKKIKKKIARGVWLIKTQWAIANAFVLDIKAGSSFGSAGAIVGIVLAVYVMAYTFPDAIVALSNSTAYSGASTAVINIATVVLPIMILFACVLYLLPSEIKSKVGL